MFLSPTHFFLYYFRFFRQFLAFFGIHQMALSLFRFIAAVGRTEVVANTLGTFTLLIVFVLGGFIIAKSNSSLSYLAVSIIQTLIYLISNFESSFPFVPVDDIEPWMIWGYYISPMMYGQNAIVINEFLDERWSAVRSPKAFAKCHFVSFKKTFISLS